MAGVVKRWHVGGRSGSLVFSEEDLGSSPFAPRGLEYIDLPMKEISGKGVLGKGEAPEKKSRVALSRALFVDSVYRHHGYKVEGVEPPSFITSYDFCYDSVKWASQEGDEGHFFGLYSREDYFSPITYAEVGYLSIFLFGRKPTFDWNTADLSGVRVSVMRESDGAGNAGINLFLRDYKAGLTMDKYIQDLRDGVRHVPIHFWCCVLEMEEAGICKRDEAFKFVGEDEVEWVLRLFG